GASVRRARRIPAGRRRPYATEVAGDSTHPSRRVSAAVYTRWIDRGELIARRGDDVLRGAASKLIRAATATCRDEGTRQWRSSRPVEPAHVAAKSMTRRVANGTLVASLAARKSVTAVRRAGNARAP